MDKRRLFGRVAIPGWLSLIAFLSEALSHFKAAAELWKSIWSFAVTAEGRIALFVFGFAWLIIVAYWPSIRARLFSPPHVVEQLFENQTITLGNTVYVKCTFRNVTFRYVGENGFDFLSCSHEGEQHIVATTHDSEGLMRLANRLSFHFDARIQPRVISDE